MSEAEISEYDSMNDDNVNDDNVNDDNSSTNYSLPDEIDLSERERVVSNGNSSRTTAIGSAVLVRPNS
jgi:hypothetical protein